MDGPVLTPYLIASVAYLTLVVALARATLSPPQARLTLLAAAVHLPAAAFAPLLEPSYWAPLRTADVRLGLEDVLITAAVASWAWFLVALRFDGRLGAPVPVRDAFRRSLLPGGAVIAGYLALWSAGADPMTALIATCFVGAVVGCARRPELVPLAAWGALALAVVWTALVALTFALAPAFVHEWNLAGAWGRRLLGVPLGEIVWAGVFGAFWPTFLGHVFRVPLHAGAHAGDSMGEVTGP